MESGFSQHDCNHNVFCLEKRPATYKGNRVIIGITMPLAPIPIFGGLTRHYVNRNNNTYYAESTQSLALSFLLTYDKWLYQLNLRKAIPSFVLEGKGFYNIEIEQHTITTSVSYKVYEYNALDIYLGIAYFNNYLSYDNSIKDSYYGGLNVGLSLYNGLCVDYNLLTNLDSVNHVMSLNIKMPFPFLEHTLGHTSYPLGINFGLENIIVDDYISYRILFELGFVLEF
jgi:hypothetical protein